MATQKNLMATQKNLMATQKNLMAIIKVLLYAKERLLALFIQVNSLNTRIETFNRKTIHIYHVILDME
jgi:hypothetical protein